MKILCIGSALVCAIASSSAHGQGVALTIDAGMKAPVQEIKRLLADTEGVQVSRRGETLVLEGFVYTLEDLHRVEAILRLHPEVINHVKSSLSHMSRESQLNRALEKAGIHTLKVHQVLDAFVLEGPQDSAERQRAEQIVQAVLKESFFPP